MASPPRQAPVIPLELLLGEGDEDYLEHVTSPASQDSSSPQSPASLSLALESPEGIDCHGNERQALVEQAKFCNSPLLSDVILVVGNERYFAHKLILVRSSDVFERMFSSEWESTVAKDHVGLMHHIPLSFVLSNEIVNRGANLDVKFVAIAYFTNTVKPENLEHP